MWQSLVSQTVGHYLVTEQQEQFMSIYKVSSIFLNTHLLEKLGRKWLDWWGIMKNKKNNSVFPADVAMHRKNYSLPAKSGFLLGLLKYVLV